MTLEEYGTAWRESHAQLMHALHKLHAAEFGRTPYYLYNLRQAALYGRHAEESDRLWHAYHYGSAGEKL